MSTAEKLVSGDLTRLAPKDTIEIQLEHPYAGKLDAYLEIAGPAHPATTAFSRRILDQRMSRENSIDLSIDELESETTELICARVVGWRGLSEEGVELEFSPEALRRVITDPRNRWLRLFCDRKLSSDSPFFES